jgi:predicted NBD/HSP70 family sugar kinase
MFLKLKKDDEVAKEVFEFTGKILGMSLANFVMFSSPEAIMLFGGLTKAGDMILKPTREHMEANVIEIFENKVKILLSHLKRIRCRHSWRFCPYVGLEKRPSFEGLFFAIK